MEPNKEITPELIRKYFGHEVVIRRRGLGGFRVSTATGTDLEIKGKAVLIHSGGEDAFRAITALAGELWGGYTASGCREHILACMAHGEALGVAVTPDVKLPDALYNRVSAVFMAGAGGLLATAVASASGEDSTRDMAMIITGCAVILIWRLMKAIHTAEERRLSQELRFQFPRVHGTPRAASHDDADRAGWL